MKKNILPLLILFSFFSEAFTQTNQTKFRIIYNWGTSGNLFFAPFGTINSISNGYTSAGWVTSSSDLLPAGFLFETDTMGNVKWARRYRGDNFGFTPMMFSDLIKSGSNYIMTGNRNSRALLMSVNSTGSTVNFRNTYLGGSSWGNKVKADASGNFIVAGGSDARAINPNKDSTSIYIFKTNSSGTFLWGRSYTLTSPVFDSHDQVNDVVAVSNGYVFTGYHSEQNGLDTTTNILLFKTDLNGTLQWMNSFGSLSTNESGQRIVYDATNNEFILVGNTDAASVFGDVFIMRTDASGNIISSAAYGTNFGVAVSDQLVQTSDGGFAIMGWAAVFSAITYKPWLVKLNSTFGHQWTKYYNPSTLGGFFTYGEEAVNKGYIFSTMSADGVNGGWANEIIKTDSQGQTDNTASSCKETNYTPAQRTFNPPTKTISPTVHTGGSGSSFSGANTSFTPARNVICMVCAKPAATASASPSTICAGSSATLTATGGGNYSWSTGATSPSIVVSPGATSTYSCWVSVVAGCDSVVVATVNVTSAPSASISGNTAICQGQTTTLTASGGGTYSWWNNGATSATITDSPSGNTTYTVTVTNAAGCTSVATANVTVNSVPTASISGNTSICAGNMTTLTASGGGTYSWWNTGASSSTITDVPTSTTTYTVTVSNGSCSSTTTATVNVNAAPSASISGSSNICQGDAATLTASGGGTYLWNTGATTATITDNPTASTAYTVTVTNAAGCSDTATITVNVLAPPVASITGNNTICAGASTTLSAQGGGNYSWNTGATTSSIVVSPATNTTYSVVVSAGSCFDATSILVTVNPSPNAGISGNTTICLGQTATLTASGGGTYSWNTGSTSAVITDAPTSATSYSVVVSNGMCDDTAAVTISVLTPPVASITSSGSSTICSGTSATLTASGGGTYVWSPGGQTASSIVVSPSATTNYTVTVSNGTCSDDASITVTVNASPTASVTASSSAICAGGSATITASGGGTYTWSPGGQTTNTISVSPSVSTSYTVTVTAANGCTASAISNVSVTPVPNPSVTVGNNTICTGTSTTLSAQGGGTYLWNPSGQTTSSIVVSPTSATTYTVIASNGNCSSSATATVNVYPSPSVSSANVSVNYGNSTTLTASPSGGTPPYSYLWSTNEVTPSILVSPTITTIYCVTVTDANGCSDTACSTVTVDFACGDLFIPNAFSPNEDGKNDYFRPRSICFKSFHFVVYDRWGIKVFETEDITTKGWDGRYNGKPGSSEAYVYHLKYELVTGAKGEKQGTVSLLR